MDLDSLDISPELREKAKACKTPEALLELAKSGGYTLTDEEMEAISGGGGWTNCSSQQCFNWR